MKSTTVFQENNLLYCIFLYSVFNWFSLVDQGDIKDNEDENSVKFFCWLMELKILLKWNKNEVLNDNHNNDNLINRIKIAYQIEIKDNHNDDNCNKDDFYA